MTLDPQLLTGMGSALSVFLAAAGSALASSHAGIYAVRGTSYKAFIPIIQAGVLAIYGIIVSILLVFKLENEAMTATDGYKNLSAGLAVGLSTCASGWGIAKFVQQLNEQGVTAGTARSATTGMNESSQSEPLIPPRAAAQKDDESTFTKTVLALVFLEAIGLYGLVAALFLMG